MYCLWPCSLAITITGRVGSWFCFFLSRSTGRLTSSSSGFKASQKMGPRLKVSTDRLGEARNRTCNPWVTRHRFIPNTTAASLNCNLCFKILTITRFKWLLVFRLIWKSIKTGIINCLFRILKLTFYASFYGKS